MHYLHHLYSLDPKSNPQTYWRSLWLDMEESTLFFETEILASEFSTKDREKEARKHSELRFINEIISGLEDYKKKYYD